MPQVLLMRTMVDAPAIVSPSQALACAVLAQAVQDARAHPVRAHRVRAAAWLQDSEAMRFWCAVAGLDPALVARRAQIALDNVA
jgi:hypothetical protein